LRVEGQKTKERTTNGAGNLGRDQRNDQADSWSE
jgi:hypothetical protein